MANSLQNRGFYGKSTNKPKKVVQMADEKSIYGYSAGMDYIEAAMRALLYRDKGNIKEWSRQAAITPNHPAVSLVQEMRNYDAWLDSAYVSGMDDAKAGRGVEWDRDKIVYAITGYTTLTYPAMGEYIERMYWQGYSVGMPIG